MAALTVQGGLVKNKMKVGSLYHLNIRSVQFKVAEVRKLIQDHNPHIFGSPKLSSLRIRLMKEH